MLRRRLSSKPLSEVESILLIIDPRAVSNLSSALLTFPSEEDAEKVTTFLLLPSVTSSPECLLCAELGLQCLCLPEMPKRDLRVVRIDDYFSEGDAVLCKMMESGKRVYPAEEVEAMLGLVAKDAALNHTDSESVPHLECSRFQVNVGEYQAWLLWVINEGVGEEDIQSSHEMLYGLLTDSES